MIMLKWYFLSFRIVDKAWNLSEPIFLNFKVIILV